MRRTWAITAGAIGTAGLLWLVLVAAPPWFVHDHTLEGLKAQNEVRTTLLQGLGGVVLLVGAYFTYRQVTNSRAQLQVAQQGQITERFTRAIDQLGHAQLDVRLGGIYALERIAYDSPADRATIGEVLTAFIRSHAPWPPRLPGQYVATASIDDVPELQVRAADVQACLTVLGRGSFAPPTKSQVPLDLHAVDLRHANLPDAHLEEANLFSAHLEGANLGSVYLEGAYLHSAHLEGAYLHDAYLERAVLIGAHLEEASLHGAHLEEAVLIGANLERALLDSTHLEGANVHSAYLERASLIGANLEGASLIRAHLEGTNLQGANLEGAVLYRAHLGRSDLRYAHLGRASDLRYAYLEGASLDGAYLEGALADERTVWPENFDWRAAGVIAM